MFIKYDRGEDLRVVLLKIYQPFQISFVTLTGAIWVSTEVPRRIYALGKVLQPGSCRSVQPIAGTDTRGNWRLFGMINHFTILSINETFQQGVKSLFLESPIEIFP